MLRIHTRAEEVQDIRYELRGERTKVCSGVASHYLYHRRVKDVLSQTDERQNRKAGLRQDKSRDPRHDNVPARVP